MLTGLGWKVVGLVFLLLVEGVRPKRDTRTTGTRIFDVSNISSSLGSLGKDLNSIYTGWVNTSIYPYFLKGSTYVNSIYGAVNRTGLIVAGAVILGASGLVLLDELNALPSMDDVVRTVDDVRNSVSSVLKGGITLPVRKTGTQLLDRADVVYTMPGPPYNYDIKAVMNLTSRLSGLNRNKKIDLGDDFPSVDKVLWKPKLAWDISDPRDSEKKSDVTSDKKRPSLFSPPPSLSKVKLTGPIYFKTFRRDHRTRGSNNSKPKYQNRGMKPPSYNTLYPSYSDQLPCYQVNKSQRKGPCVVSVLSKRGHTSKTKLNTNFRTGRKRRRSRKRRFYTRKHAVIIQRGGLRHFL